ncbi:hypothetical protein IF188_05595 [Microbacterium sp. NEAU-LLC]|uniref:Uncharacterized protein n=1 Tax=Microbacterium helvum TaxID=2773713 RepID=A0ABR8NQ53_9MICO|nr:hypothetical protein [Microbacterium helvum]MBD3941171.1 hypothetical protein [Microbacterium helvum]
MSSNTTLSGAARNRLFAFNGTAWIVGLVLIVIIAVAVLANAVGDSGGGASSDYGYEPWLNPDPPVATDEGDGVYSGVDGSVIRLTGLDPDQPLLVTELNDTYVGRVYVTGPGGEVLTPGEYGEAPEFDSYSSDGQLILVPQADVELWIDGFSDERWQLQITEPEVEQRSGVVSGIGPAAFFLGSDATTARVSVRGDGYLDIETVTVAGTTDIFSSSDATDQSIAWADADPVLFRIEAGSDTAWSIDFPDAPAASDQTPAATPTEGAPTPGATEGATP